MSLGEQLRADQNIGFAALDALQRARKLCAAPRTVAIDAHDARAGKRRGERLFDALRAAPHRLQVDVAAAGAGAGNGAFCAAVMAAQRAAHLMHHHARGAASAARSPAAGLAGEHRRVAAPIDEHQALLVLFESRFYCGEERCRQTLLDRGLPQVDRANRRQSRARHGALGELEALVATRLPVVPGLKRRRCATEDRRAAGELRAVHRDVSRRVAQALLLLERAVVLLVDHDERQSRQRREHREARAEHDACVAARGIQPGAGARHVLQAAVQERDPRLGEGVAKDRLELGREADFRYQDERLGASRKSSGNEVQVHLGLSAAGHPVQQERAEAANHARHPIQGARLSRVERMVRNEARRRRRRGALERFARQRLHRAQARRQRADHRLAERALVIA